MQVRARALATLITIALGTGGAAGQGMALFDKVPDAAIRGHNTRRLKDVDPAACARACVQEDWCRSFDFYKRKRECDLSSKTSQDAPLKRDYEGNPYDHYVRKASAPSALGSFRRVPDAAIRGHNDFRMKSVTPADCAVACLAEPWCRSFDFYKGERTCDLSSKRASDVGGLKKDYETAAYDHYERAPPKRSVCDQQCHDHCRGRGFRTGKFAGVSLLGTCSGVPSPFKECKCR